METVTPRPKPFVQVACVCEKVLVEPDSVPSLIRVVDTYFVEKTDLPPEVAPELPRGINLTVYVALKSGDVVGEFSVGLRLSAPDNTEAPIKRWPVEFRGQEHGVSLNVGFFLANPKFGLYWFDVLWGDEILTRIPLRFKPKNPAATDETVAPIETVSH